MQRQRPTGNARLRAAREARNLTQADVARQLGISKLTVSRWELGTQTPAPHHRSGLCRVYGATSADLGLAPAAPDVSLASEDASTPPPAAAGPARPPAAPDWDDGTADPAEARARRDLLTQVERYWIGTRLEAAMEPLPNLALTLVERAAAVDDPRDVAAPPRPGDRPLPPGTGIGDVYHRLGEQLLILGEPGGGKTTLLLQLGKELLADDRRGPAAPMPVVFHLASWAQERRPLDGWLVDELHRRYGVAPRLGRRWIASDQVLPLLDGLDEVADRHRVGCVEAINAFHRDHGQLPMVVCCRTAWYESLGVRLAMRGAVNIMPLDQADVRRYLDDAGDDLADLRALLDEDEQLRELLTTPLFLSIATVAYRDRSAAGTGPSESAAERRRQLLGDYVDAVLSRASPRPPYPHDRTLGWLSWLARTMREHDQSVVNPDWIQPSWLPSGVRPWLVTRGVTVGMGLAGGLLVGLNWGADWGLSLGPTMFALIGVTVGLMVATCHAIVIHESRIVPAERLRWSWSALRQGLRRWSGIGLAVGVLCGLAFGVVLAMAVLIMPDVLSGARSAGAGTVEGAVTLPRALLTGAVSGLVNGAGLGVTIALTFGLLSGLDTSYGVVDLAPGESVEASRRNAIVGGLVGGVVFAVAYGLAYGWGTTLTGQLVHHAASTLDLAGVYWPVAAPNDLVVAALLGALIAGLQRGGGAYVRHRTLMAILVRTGCAPRDYVAFLEYASRLVLVRRRSGGYEFVHRMLLDYFAGLPRAATGRADRTVVRARRRERADVGA